MKKALSALVFLLFAAHSLFANNSNEEENIRKNFQFSFLTPIGSNGSYSHRAINRISINLLGGYSYANTAFEAGGLYNINTGWTKGFQLAGLFNYTGKSLHAAQVAGIANISRKGCSSFQLAGLVNAGADIDGLQMSGLVNVANRVKGVQLGLINYADESEGISIGLINIIRKGGKHEFEVSFSETLHTALSFRLGTDKLYTIFSAGVNYTKKNTEYAAGLGLGTHIDWKKQWANQIELTGYGLTENGSFRTDGVRMLLQLRCPVSKTLGRHFTVFAGPTVNMTITETSSSDSPSKTWSPWHLWKSNNGNTQFRGWIGMTAGVRF